VVGQQLLLAVPKCHGNLSHDFSTLNVDVDNVNVNTHTHTHTHTHAHTHTRIGQVGCSVFHSYLQAFLSQSTRLVQG
jgi:hypothetical protein